MVFSSDLGKMHAVPPSLHGPFVCIPACACRNHCELNDLIQLILLDFILAKLKIKTTLPNKNVQTFELLEAFEHWLNFKIHVG